MTKQDLIRIATNLLEALDAAIDATSKTDDLGEVGTEFDEIVFPSFPPPLPEEMANALEHFITRHKD
ncbi:MAG: hypothetical protein KJ945_02215 [Gammaproteobacteria bacterium]|nr:hypothetical protein [Gammaproteobacteria bacterium]MBU0801654.1 hypothetical protein [Alphaproteobacteria bacterium]MBU0836148.1 hypothetical protein [Gammaproteobacteria bacterium]MBU1803827.1 hypothetical protein [Gammaproteobacteria bacterium]